MRQSLKILLLSAGLALYAYILPFAAASAPVSKDIKQLPIEVGVFYEEDIEFFNTFLSGDDFVFSYGVKPWLLKKIKGPKIVVSVQTISDMRKAFERSRETGITIDYIIYNPEIWGVKSGKTKREEIENLSDALKNARKIADHNGAVLSFGTDYLTLEKQGENIASLTDRFGIQLQRYQRDSIEEFRKEALKKVSLVRKGDHNVPLFLQLSLAPPKWQVKTKKNGDILKAPIRDKNGKKLQIPVSAEDVLKKIEAVKDLADGITILYTKENRGEMKRLIRLLRR